MTEFGALQHLQQVPTDPCPTWCASQHGVQEGEEDWVHVGAPLQLGNGVHARLCMSRDPETGRQDGPVVLIGEKEYTLTEAAALGVSLAALALGVDGT